ncbi:hypothetical protein FNH22_05465 [Fulvivirga sp. M361]|uniref:DUF2945 domain-containing protein n=1 Tax=Fulvivirga sp. M361 TaxID=2594266 RepID=UPI001179CB1F|nr:DUF2945 domain-containing protein [Fulvivirga sp. M361]TRX60500.1 hypothetical protein FNH22_05465 [Fulvivirga sp. M361]
MIRKGSKVTWSWGTGTAEGKVQETYTKTVLKTINGNKVTRNGEPGNKALFIRQEDGSEVLKLASEVKPAN